MEYAYYVGIYSIYINASSTLVFKMCAFYAQLTREVGNVLVTIDFFRLLLFHSFFFSLLRFHGNLFWLGLSVCVRYAP